MSEPLHQTLPLFDDLEPAPVPPGLRLDAEAGSAPAVEPGGQATDAEASSWRTPARTSTDQERHLRAARRLSRAMWRFPERSAEETRAGIAICRHLQALLADQDSSAGR
jgi:hypothetical protein